MERALVKRPGKHHCSKHRTSTISKLKQFGRNRKRAFYLKTSKPEDGGVKEETSYRDGLVVGTFTREVFNAICLRYGYDMITMGDTIRLPEDWVKTLFNDMKLFPSDAQVTKMLQCARQYSRRNVPNSHPNYLTFGEFCLFVREMQSHPTTNTPRLATNKSSLKLTNKCPNNKCEVFLGGSCNPTTWRADIAIPELNKHGISFYNPQVSMWAPELMAQEQAAKQSASVLLFVIDSQTRSTVGMLEVAYLVASGRCVVVVAQPYRPGQTIMGEAISETEYRTLGQGQHILLDLIKSKGVQIHNSLLTALQCTADILKTVSLNGTTAEEQVTNKLKRLREVYDSYSGNMKAEDVIEAHRRLTNRTVEISKMYAYLDLHRNNNLCNDTQEVLTFEKFCAIMAELTTDGCGMCNIEAWANQTFSQQPNQSPIQPNPKPDHPLYDIYLGGSLSSGTKWRETIAVPLLTSNELKYYNPAIREKQDDVSKWCEIIDNSKVALFVITNDTRSLTTMILAAHYIGIGKPVVLCIQQLSEDCIIANETLSKVAIKDYNRVRTYLKDLAERLEVPVFDNVRTALDCVVAKLDR